MNDRKNALIKRALKLKPDHYRVGFFDSSGKNEDFVPLSRVAVLVITHGRERRYAHGERRAVTLSVLPMVYMSRRVVIGTKRMFSKAVRRDDDSYLVKFSKQELGGFRAVGLMRDLLEDNKSRRRNFCLTPGRRSILNTGMRVSDDQLLDWSLRMLDPAVDDLEELEGDSPIKIPRFYAPVSDEDEFLTLRSKGARKALNSRLKKCAVTGEWPIPGTSIVSHTPGEVTNEGGNLSFTYNDEEGDKAVEPLDTAFDVQKSISNKLRELFGPPRIVPLTPVAKEGTTLTVDEFQTLYRPIEQDNWGREQLAARSDYESLCLLASLTSLKWTRGIPMLDLRYAHGAEEPYVDLGGTFSTIQRVPNRKRDLTSEEDDHVVDLFNHSLRYWLKAKSPKATALGKELNKALSSARANPEALPKPRTPMAARRSKQGRQPGKLPEVARLKASTARGNEGAKQAAHAQKMCAVEEDIVEVLEEGMKQQVHADAATVEAPSD